MKLKTTQAGSFMQTKNIFILTQMGTSNVKNWNIGTNTYNLNGRPAASVLFMVGYFSFWYIKI